MTKSFKIFQGGPKTHFNACVGANGDPDIVFYYDGYFIAAKTLLEKVITDHPSISVDIAIYPILFNLRHAIELSLKKNLSEIIKLKKFRPILQIEEQDFSKHDLRPLWQSTKDTASLLDDEYEPIISEIDDLIIQIATIDPTGQTFRYPNSLGSQIKHLDNFSIINIERILVALNKIQPALKDLIYLTRSIQNEYGLGTYTADLSRKDIQNISLELMNKNQWTKNKFRENKESIKAKYNIGSGKLSKIINVIQNHYEFCLNIGEERQIHDLSPTEMNYFIQSWIDHYKLLDTSEPWDVNTYRDTTSECSHKIAENITLQATKWISAIYHIGRDEAYCEEAEYYFNLYHDDQAYLIYHMIVKSKFLEFFPEGLKRMGQKTLLEKFNELT